MPPFLIYGTFMRGQPGHANLQGTHFLEPVETASHYRLWEIDGRWPALIELADGIAVAGELYQIDEPQLARLAALEPPGWNRAPVELADGRTAEAFLGDASLCRRGRDVSAHGSWAAYRASRERGS